MQIVDRATWRAQPWKNGRGTTLEIVRWRLATDIDRRPTRAADGTLRWAFDDTSDDDYDLRVSLAEVATSGPFSTFAGYRRHTFLVGPAPIRLGDVALVAPGDHVELSGAREIDAVLAAGPTRLLNILVRDALPIAVGHGPTAHNVRFAFDLATGDAHVSDPPAPLPARDAVWIAS